MSVDSSIKNEDVENDGVYHRWGEGQIFLLRVNPKRKKAAAVALSAMAGFAMLVISLPRATEMLVEHVQAAQVERMRPEMQQLAEMDPSRTEAQRWLAIYSKDVESSYDTLAKLAGRGDPASAYMVAQYNLAKGEESEGAYWMEQAAKMGYPAAVSDRMDMSLGDLWKQTVESKYPVGKGL